jgi:hypothetical protein
LRSYLEEIHHKKRAVGVVQSEGPEFKLQYQKEKKRERILVAHACDPAFLGG